MGHIQQIRGEAFDHALAVQPKVEVAKDEVGPGRVLACLWIVVFGVGCYKGRSILVPILPLDGVYSLKMAEIGILKFSMKKISSK